MKREKPSTNNDSLSIIESLNIGISDLSNNTGSSPGSNSSSRIGSPIISCSSARLSTNVSQELFSLAQNNVQAVETENLNQTTRWHHRHLVDIKHPEEIGANSQHSAEHNNSLRLDHMVGFFAFED